MEKIVLLKKSWDNSLTYRKYQELIDDLVSEGERLETQDDLFHYVKLNQKRQKRLDKTIVISEDICKFLKNYKKSYKILVITEPWCADSAQSLPILNKMISENPSWQMRIVQRDSNLPLMDMFLTEGARSIPKVIFLDADSFQEAFTWGPRPSLATQMVKNYKDKFGKLTLEFKEELQLWYHRDGGENIISDICNLLKN